jgi:hypothetical protein
MVYNSDTRDYKSIVIYNYLAVSLYFNGNFQGFIQKFILKFNYFPDFEFQIAFLIQF